MRLRRAAFVLAFLLYGVAAQSSASASERVIPFPKGHDTVTEGASSYAGKSDAKDSPYFKTPDFYNMKSDGRGLYIITGYKTYQQTNETSCGPAAALTVLHYYGVKTFDEPKLAELMGTINTMAPDSSEIGTSTLKIVTFFESLDWNVASSLTSADKNGVSFKSIEEFREFAISNIQSGIPIMAENMYWGGHWRVIIGYDTMNTPQIEDDILIYSDSYDVNDHKQDGYMAENAGLFYYTWMDVGMLPPGQQLQQWVTAHPKEHKQNK